MADITPIVPLENIAVDDDDLTARKGDIGSGKYLLSGWDDFVEPILKVKRDLYNDIQSNTGYDDEQMALVKDTSNQTMLDKISFMAIAEILRANNLYDAASVYDATAAQIPLKYTYDENEDDIQDDGEVELVNSTTFGR